jgi:sugar-phosphatase
MCRDCFADLLATAAEILTHRPESERRGIADRASLCDTRSMPSFVCQAILFDLDGVLVDSTAVAGRIWKTWAQEQGLDPEYMVRFAHGRPTIETVRLVAPHLDAQHETSIIEDREVNDVDGLKPVPGAKEMLAAVPPERYAIVTSGSRRLATARLKAAGLPAPTQMIAADDITKGKPDPEPYFIGAKLVGYQPQDCMVFEDSPAGVHSAKSAGMSVIALTTTFPAAALAEADAIVENFAAVKLDRLQSGEMRITAA